jgi:hypothetical protein
VILSAQSSTAQINMAHQTQTPLPPATPSEIKYEEASSQVGAAYEIGRPDVPQPPVDEDRVGSKADFKVTVNWTAGADAWIDTPIDIRNTTAIWRYKLHLSSHPLFKYALEISITDDHYDYYFGDATGDAYQISTWVAGDHLVRFNSKNSTITSISGS